MKSKQSWVTILGLVQGDKSWAQTVGQKQGQLGWVEGEAPQKACYFLELLPFLETSGAPGTHLLAIIPHFQRATLNPCNQICPLKAEIAAHQGWWAGYRKMRATPTSRRPQGQLAAHSWAAQCPPWLVHSPECRPVNRPGLCPLAQRFCSSCRLGAWATPRSLPPWEERQQFKVTSHFLREDKTGSLLTPGPTRAWLISCSVQSQSNISDL